MIQSYTVTPDAEIDCPSWLARRSDYRKVYNLSDGASRLYGIVVGKKLVRVGERVEYDGHRVYVRKEEERNGN